MSETTEETGTFERDLVSLINSYSRENDSDTADFLLAEYLCGCLDVYSKTIRKRDDWFGFEPFSKYSTK